MQIIKSWPLLPLWNFFFHLRLQRWRFRQPQLWSQVWKPLRGYNLTLMRVALELCRNRARGLTSLPTELSDCSVTFCFLNRQWSSLSFATMHFPRCRFRREVESQLSAANNGEKMILMCGSYKLKPLFFRFLCYKHCFSVTEWKGKLD